MTYSIAARSTDGSELGVAVASKFLAVGAYVPAAAVGAGAVATQAYGNLALRTDGLALLRNGTSASQLLSEFFADDPRREERQAGAVDARGDAATFTGQRVQPWAGGRTGCGPEGSFAVQGNMLAGPEVVDAMVDSWCEKYRDSPLACRLLASLRAGEDAGGDPRGKQAAALIVVVPGGGYGGLSDVVVDLRCDDAPEPIGELERMLALHELYFGTTPDDELLLLDGSPTGELRISLARLGFDSGDVVGDLYAWMGRENFEERWHDGKIDPVVLDYLRDSLRRL